MSANQFLVVKDEDGVLRPQAGVWRDNESGQAGARLYQNKNPEITIVKVNFTEIE